MMTTKSPPTLRRLFSALVVVGAVAVVQPPAAHAQATVVVDESSPPATTEDVLRLMHEKNAVAIELGALAREQGESSRVQALGRRIENDHRIGDRLVLALAADKGLELSPDAADTPAAVTESTADLRSLTGDSFDREFVATVLSEHESMVAMLIAAKADLPDDVRALVEKLIPILTQGRTLALFVQARIPAHET